MSFDEKHLFHRLKHYLPTQAALKDFVHHNPLHAMQDQEFFHAIFSASKIFGIKATFSLNEYRKLHEMGRIRTPFVERVVLEQKGAAEAAGWQEKMLKGSYPHLYEPRMGRLRGAWKPRLKFSLDDRVQPLLFRLIGGYLDQGIALWHFPFEDQGLIKAIRTLEKNSLTSLFSSKRVKRLLSGDDLSLADLLSIVVGREELYEQYVLDQQFAHKGWSGIINAIEDQPGTLFYEKKIELRDFVMLELLLEIDAIDQELGEGWEPLGNDPKLGGEDYFAKVETGEMEEILKLWHLAFEWDYYDGVLAGVRYLNKKQRRPAKTEISFQTIFCVDDRECSLRRHFESVDPDCETYGAPGFFGVAIFFKPFGGRFVEKNCPVPVTPKHLIKEVEANYNHGSVPFHDKQSHTFFRGFASSLSLGLVSGGRMMVDLLRPSMRPDIANSFAHMDVNGRLLIQCEDPSLVEHGVQVGYTLPEMAEVVGGILRGIGLTQHFADLIYLMAHGSSSANNPHHGAYDCGACSGRPGAPNARVFATMANQPEVRALLREEGIVIPERTHFLAAMHDTASDEIG